ncbi:hypothetical protein M514_12214 [Trichuris suis]|uniref:Reverse transcriptase domain-containing protein n=1 Tax=Trichuris suis TaxID=68888 RepID=A0A085N441_9BILA|nr:hypothetical protein M513_12214 [Trichuris suis]KFD64237.1 hypothetical protein M514_12214 [Trichuris suis]
MAGAQGPQTTVGSDHHNGRQRKCCTTGQVRLQSKNLLTLLSSSIYNPLPSDPTEQVRKSLQTLLNQFASKTGDEVLDHVQRYTYFISNTKCPELYGLPKIHKPGVPPQASSLKHQHSVSPRLCSYLESTLKSLMATRSPYARNSKDFCSEVRQFSTAPMDIMVSYDVKDLFPGIPMAQTLNVLEDLEADETLTQRTKLNPFHILKFQGSKIPSSFRRMEPQWEVRCPILAEVFMEHLEDKAFTNTEAPVVLRFFKLYVDDIFAIIEASKEELLLEYLNSLFPHCISFTIEKES